MVWIGGLVGWGVGYKFTSKSPFQATKTVREAELQCVSQNVKSNVDPGIVSPLLGCSPLKGIGHPKLINKGCWPKLNLAVQILKRDRTNPGFTANNSGIELCGLPPVFPESSHPISPSCPVIPEESELTMWPGEGGGGSPNKSS